MYEVKAATLHCERAIDEFRRQMGLLIQAEDARLLACPLEQVDAEILAGFSKLSGVSLVISAARAGYLGLGGSQPLQLDVGGLPLETLNAIASPLAASTALPKLEARALGAAERAALALVKYASLLPAVLVAPCEELPEFASHWQTLDAQDVEIYQAVPEQCVLAVTQAKLPIKGAEDARVMSFRTQFGTSVHLALLVGDPQAAAKTGAAPLVRVHSSCVTGDILGSLRCDCGDQLHLALQAIITAGSGVLIYLHQEGRGIGIANKLRAYQLQEQGLDTFAANLAIGFDEDERDFGLAAAILKQLGLVDIRLLTNNPHKLEALEEHGIAIRERVKVAAPTHSHNEYYIRAKAEKSGHLF